ncbi:peptidase M10 [Streptomyces mesophilus]|uniref:peptidase M10 n=1 Tax=Streptomyces mesophilus TaxID=1775132 RepID=UPI00332D45FB
MLGRSLIVFTIASSMGLAYGSAQVSATEAESAVACDVPAEGKLTMADLPPGSSATECGAIGRVVTYGSIGVTVPNPGTSVTVHALLDDGSARGFTMVVDSNGSVSYREAGTPPDDNPFTDGADTPDVLPNPAVTGADLTTESDATDADEPGGAIPGEALVQEVDVAAVPSACSDGAYNMMDQKEYGTYNWYLGDGGMPGAISRSDAYYAFHDAITNITQSSNNCGLADQVSASASYKGYTSYEADISSGSECTSRDGKSTWDAGNLISGHIAVTCSWNSVDWGDPDDLREADVRYNTTDKNFTDYPTSSCYEKYDVRAVGTHEAGHVFGMDHVGSGHNNLTMYGGSSPFKCSISGRTLGKGDVLGLRSRY